MMYIADFVSKMRPRHPVVALFADGVEAQFTAYVFDFLITVPSVVHVYDGETGEILYHQ